MRLFLGLGTATFFTGALLVLAAEGCGSSEDTSPRAEDGGTFKRDATTVDALDDGGGAEDAGTGPSNLTCTKYCDVVMSNCIGPYAQYASGEECLAFCAKLPPGKAGEKEEPTLACRAYWAGNPARTDPSASCFAAGPFGGGTCGDRCTAYCDLVLAACPVDGGAPVYGSQPDCATACAQLAYKDAGADGGGEGPNGPSTGDTLNCRLFHLRDAVQNEQACGSLQVDSGTCE